MDVIREGYLEERMSLKGLDAISKVGVDKKPYGKDGCLRDDGTFLCVIGPEATLYTHQDLIPKPVAPEPSKKEFT